MNKKLILLITTCALISGCSFGQQEFPFNRSSYSTVNTLLRDKITLEQTAADRQWITDESCTNGKYVGFLGGIAGMFRFLYTSDIDDSIIKSLPNIIIGAALGYYSGKYYSSYKNKNYAELNKAVQLIIHEARSYKNLLILIEQSNNSTYFIEKAVVELASFDYPLVATASSLKNIISFFENTSDTLEKILETHDSVDFTTRTKLEFYLSEVRLGLRKARIFLLDLKNYATYNQEVKIKQADDLERAKIYKEQNEANALYAQAQAAKAEAHASESAAHAYNMAATESLINSLFGRAKVQVQVNHTHKNY